MISLSNKISMAHLNQVLHFCLFVCLKKEEQERARVSISSNAGPSLPREDGASRRGWATLCGACALFYCF